MGVKEDIEKAKMELEATKEQPVEKPRSKAGGIASNIFTVVLILAMLAFFVFMIMSKCSK